MRVIVSVGGGRVFFIHGFSFSVFGSVESEQWTETQAGVSCGDDERRAEKGAVPDLQSRERPILTLASSFLLRQVRCKQRKSRMDRCLRRAWVGKERRRGRKRIAFCKGITDGL